MPLARNFAASAVIAIVAETSMRLSRAENGLLIAVVVAIFFSLCTSNLKTACADNFFQFYPQSMPATIRLWHGRRYRRLPRRRRVRFFVFRGLD
jgi:hypothetical protein